MSEETDRTTHRPARRSRGARTFFAVAATVTGLVSIGLLAGGGASLWADGHKNDQGFITTGSERFSTHTAALATANMDFNLDGLGALTEADHLGRIQLKVDSRSGKPVFVGIARTSDVDGYLGGVSHTTVTNVDYDPFSADFRDHDGTRTAARPDGRRIWAASAQGTGSQTMTWKVRDGDWSIVVMNADGSPGVHADIDAGAKVPFLTALGWGALGGGLLMLVATAALIALGIGPRGPRPQPAMEVVPAAAS